MYKNIGLGLLFVALIVVFGMRSLHREVKVESYSCMDKNIPTKAELECRHIREFKRPQMDGGCVFQESQGRVIKTCG
jgi:hypothetical protein